MINIIIKHNLLLLKKKLKKVYKKSNEIQKFNDLITFNPNWYDPRKTKLGKSTSLLFISISEILKVSLMKIK